MMTMVADEVRPSPVTPTRRYCLITPCRDEAKYARRTLDSIVNQTVTPTLWVIVDDGSKDETPQIMEEYAAKHPWIKLVRRADRGERKVGGGVVDAFYAGYDTIDPDDFDYVTKIDLDLDIPPRYFEKMLEHMEANPRLATFSGKPYMDLNGVLVSEKCGDENSVGMIKFYRVPAFKQIGGFVRMVMWDGIDCHRCRMLGWQAASLDEPETRFIHLRPMGTSHKSWWTGRVRHGTGQYFMGTGFVYMLASCVFRMFHPPIIVGSWAMIWGWLKSFVSGAKRYEDPAFRKFVNRYQWACLFKGKKRATAEVEAERAGDWNPIPSK